MKKILIYSLIILNILIFTFTLSGCKKNDKNNKEILEQKINSEISYIESELVAIANMMNNIDYVRYKVVSENIKESSKTTETGEGESSANKKSGEEKNLQENETGNNQDSEISGQNSENSESSNKAFSIEPNNLLEGNDVINWNKAKSKIENLYTTWTIVSIDLKEAGISEIELDNFINYMDLLAEAIKNEDKNKTMESVVSLYKFLPDLVGKYASNDKEKNVLSSKYNLLECYKYADLENWQEFDKSFNELKNNFSKITNKMDEYNGKSVNIKSASVIINEINNSSKLQNKQVFFIKYKNLIQELNIILTL